MTADLVYLAEFPTLNPKQNKISYGRRMLTKRKVSCTPYTPGCIYVYIYMKKFYKKIIKKTPFIKRLKNAVRLLHTYRDLHNS